VSEMFWLRDFIKDFGASVLIVTVVWRAGRGAVGLIDRWAGQFLESNQEQAKAMGSLADAVKTSRDDQRDVLIATRVMARQLEEQHDLLKEIRGKLS